jgi:exodeoxyribonuclease V alpha subunit
VRLTEVFRQAAQSRIITSAHRINQGFMPDLARPRARATSTSSGDDPEQAVPRIVELVQGASRALRPRSDPRHPGALPDEPRRRRRPLAQHRAAGRAQPGRRAKVERFGWTFAPGDKVMQIENDYDKEVYNGDIGYDRRCRSRRGAS